MFGSLVLNVSPVLMSLQGLFSKNSSSAHQVDVAALIEALMAAKSALTPTINLPSMDVQVGSN